MVEKPCFKCVHPVRSTDKKSLNWYVRPDFYVIDTDYIVVRYGKLCHQFLTGRADRSTEVWSTTKTMGGVVTGAAAYETRNLPRTGRKTGPLSDTDRVGSLVGRFQI